MNDEKDVPSFLKKTPKIAPADPLENVPLEPLSTEPKKKPHKLRNFLLILFALAFVAGGIFYFFFFIYNSPENVALGAVKNLLSAENVALDGKIFIKDTAIVENGDTPKFPFDYVSSMTLEFDSDSSSSFSAGVSNMTLVVEPRDEKLDPLEFTIGSILPSNGKVYFYVNGLKDAVSEIVEKDLEEKGLDFEDLESVEDYEDVIDSESFFYLSELIETLGELDKTWVEVSADDVVEIVGEFLHLNTLEKSKIVEVINCLGNVGGNLKTRLSEISDIYEKLKFVELGKGSDKNVGPKSFSLTSDYYYLSFSPKVMADFLSEVRNSRVGKDLWSCAEKFERETTLEILENSEKVSLDEETVELIENYNKDYVTYVEIDKSRVLKKVSATNSLSAVNSHGEKPYISVDLEFSYPDSVEIKTPSEYVPLSDLISTLKANLAEE